MSAQSVPLRKLGKDGPSVPALGLGLMVVAGAYGDAPGEEERLQFLDRAFELGETFWDTADIYGDNEEMVGKWFKRTGKRDEIFLATKFGLVMAGKTDFRGIDSTADYCRQCCESSLKRLGVDSIDLYYAHRLNPETPVEETMRALAQLKAQGKIKHIGLSEVNANNIRRASKIAPVAAVQMEYSPFLLDIERDDVLQTCRELGISVVCSSPLGRGLLTSAYATRESISGEGDIRGSMFPRFNEENMDANVKLASQFSALASKKGCTMPQLALAWLLKQGEEIIPIPGTKRIKYLEENWASLKIQLTDAEEAEVRKFLESVEMRGYKSPSAAKAIDRADTKADA